MVYVDDFKLVGLQTNLEKGWCLLRKAGLHLDPPTPLGDHLGCGQQPHKVSAKEAQNRLSKHIHPLLERAEATTASTEFGKEVRATRYDMRGFFEQCVDVYCDLAKVKRESLRKATTPSIDAHQIKPEDFEQEGFLTKDAAKIVMKALYGARRAFCGPFAR